MSNAEKHRECIRRAEAAEAAANLRKKQISDQQWRDLRMKVEANPRFWSGRNLEIEHDMKVSAETAKDPVFKAAVADNQWYISQATMYGIAALVNGA